MSETYEHPTDELRQVRHSEWVGDHLLVYYKVQRKWNVQDGDSYNWPVAKSEGDILIDTIPSKGTLLGFDLYWCAVKVEWRDLHEVNAEDLQKAE